MALAQTLPSRRAVRPASPQTLRSMGLAESLAMFGVPALLLALSLYVLRPALIGLGLSAPISFTISLTLINAGLLVASILGYLHEGHPLTWSAFAARMRFGHMGAREWKWTLGGTVVLLALSVLMSYPTLWVMNLFNFTPPSTGSYGGEQALVWTGLVFNIVGEELWWRGYILPRQELAFGKQTWLVHGVMWACFHVFKWWSVPAMMITCLVVPFVTQRLKNTWPAVLMHFTQNGLGNIAFITVLLMQLLGVK